MSQLILFYFFDEAQYLLNLNAKKSLGNIFVCQPIDCFVKLPCLGMYCRVSFRSQNCIKSNVCYIY